MCNALRDKVVDLNNQKLIRLVISFVNGVMCASKILIKNEGYCHVEIFLRTSSPIVTF